jgi:ABC-type nitrate/sulfonate/bicarbonate transport system, permease component
MIRTEHEKYLLSIKRRKALILCCRGAVATVFFLLWELLAHFKVIDAFITSSPLKIVKTLVNLWENDLLLHLWTTVSETLAGFSLGVILGLLLATLLWFSPLVCKVFEPYLVVLNAVPKIALGPVIIIWAGAGQGAIIIMAIAISLIVTVLDMLSGFCTTPQNLILMAKSFGGGRLKIFRKIVLPSSLPILFNSLKINIGLSLVGVITGEFLVSKAGLGYLIVYGGQVFRLDLVMASVVILTLLAAVLYSGVSLCEKIFIKHLR